MRYACQVASAAHLDVMRVRLRWRARYSALQSRGRTCCSCALRRPAARMAGPRGPDRTSD